MTEAEDASDRTVGVAVAANLLTAVAKGVAADTFNEVLVAAGGGWPRSRGSARWSS